jgi:hypothetical protein
MVKSLSTSLIMRGLLAHPLQIPHPHRRLNINNHLLMGVGKLLS